MAKMVNETFADQKTGGVNITMQIWHLYLPCLPYIYPALFI